MRAMKIAVFAVLLGVAPAIAQDLVKVRPDRVRVEFENEQIRVLRVRYEPHEQLPTHSHPGGIVIWLTHHVRQPDGTLRMMPVTGPRVGIWVNGVTHQSEGGPIGIGYDPYDAPMETIEIEIKTATIPAVEVRHEMPLSRETVVTSSLKEPVPVELEPHHHVFYENQFVRVLDVYFPREEPSLFHTHNNDNVSVALSGDFTKSQPMGGEWSEPVPVIHGAVAFHKAHGQPYTHRVGSAGEKPFHVIDVEIFPAATK